MVILERVLGWTKRSDRTFGRTIRERRLHLGVTQREVALRIGASTPYIGHLEANKRHPSDKVLVLCPINNFTKSLKFGEN